MQQETRDAIFKEMDQDPSTETWAMLQFAASKLRLDPAGLDEAADAAFWDVQAVYAELLAQHGIVEADEEAWADAWDVLCEYEPERHWPGELCRGDAE